MVAQKLSREQRNTQTKQRNANRKATNVAKMEAKTKLPAREQLAELDNRLGRGRGAKKERTKLLKALTA